MKVNVIVSSRKEQKDNKEFVDNVKSTAGMDVDVFYCVNDGSISLTKIYQEALDECNCDIVVYMHDDIEVLSKDWATELVRLFNENKEYGIIGVAGSAQFDANAAWWQYKKIFGQVLHRSQGRAWLTTFSDVLGDKLAEVCVVDGLFFAVKKDRVKVGFDTSIEGFNFYEIDFCLANYLEGVKIGVTTNIRLAHNSVGETKKNWFDNKIVVNEKYKQHYPIEVEDGKKRKVLP